MRKENNVAFLTVNEVKELLRPVVLQSAYDGVANFVEGRDKELDIDLFNGCRLQLNDFPSLCNTFNEIPDGAIAFFKNNPEINFIVILHGEQLNGNCFTVDRKSTEEYAAKHNL